MKSGTDSPIARNFAGFMGSNDRTYVLIILLFILLGLSLKFYLLFRCPVNQDEFLYLSGVHAYERGALSLTFQSLHVHFFGWLDAFSNNEVTQVMVARSVMFLFFLGTCAYLFLLGLCFLHVLGALFCVLCYIAFLFTITNGASFRSDTVATFLSMLALYQFVVKEESPASNALAGLAMALACLFTIKAGMYLILFIPLSLIRLRASQNSLRSLKHTSYFAVALILGFIAIYGLHAATFPDSNLGNQAGFLGSTFSTFITFERFFPALEYFLLTLRTDRVIWLLMLFGFCVYVFDLLRRKHYVKGHAAYLLIMLVPLLSLLIYRNAYPYFYVFLMPSATLFCGYGFCRLISTVKQANQRLSIILASVLTILVFQNFILFWPFLSRRAAQTTAAQHDLLSEIHKMFPDPVPYIDGCSMVSSFPKVGFYMCSADMGRYLEANEPIIKRMLAQKKPVFLLANVPHLDLRCEGPPVSVRGQSLMKEDWAALKSCFIHHWGPIWVAGKRFDVGSEDAIRPFEIIPGPYTVEGGADFLIDGTLHHSGDVMQLKQGTHTIQVQSAGVTIKLRWGEHLYRPKKRLNAADFFLGPLL